MNIDTILWLDTDADVTLGTVTLLGYRVTLRAHVTSVDWHFGDGAQDTSASPGRRYYLPDPCRTARCPGYFVHSYRRAGRSRSRPAWTWSARFRVDGGAWQRIDRSVSGPATTEALWVREARGVLVCDP